MKKALITGVAALLLATGEPVSAAGVDYVCGDIYSIVVEPKDRTYTSFDGDTQTYSTSSCLKELRFTTTKLARNGPSKLSPAIKGAKWQFVARRAEK